MSLLGQGVLTIWNDIDASAEADFVAWHVREHIPERVGVPGFLRGRRYVAIEGSPKYFNFYETKDIDVLTSAAYQARLNDPTEWTRRVVTHFKNTSRTMCTVAATYGCGEGAWIEAIRLNTVTAAHEFKSLFTSGVLLAAMQQAGIVGAHLLQGQSIQDQTETAEKKLRGQPDQTADWVALIEGVEPDAIIAIRQTISSNDAFLRHGAGPRILRGLYRLQYGLTRTELDSVQK